MQDDIRNETKRQNRHPSAANDNGRAKEVAALYETWPDGGLSEEARFKAPLVAVLFDSLSNGDPRLTIGMLSAILIELRLYMHALGNDDMDDPMTLRDALWLISKRIEATIAVAQGEIPFHAKPTQDAASGR